MAWTFRIATGELLKPDGSLATDGAYSGHPPHVNDAAAVSLKGLGPLPPGQYLIGAPLDPPDHLGPLAMPLTPADGHEMYGRSAFFIHGDNPALDHTASDGCIILDHDLREQIAQDADRQLVVVVD